MKYQYLFMCSPTNHLSLQPPPPPYIQSGSSNPFAGASALVNKNKGTSVNLNFKAGKMDAWAEETAKQKENRETSFQLIARYKFLKKGMLLYMI
jgi:hypothetical protein